MPSSRPSLPVPEPLSASETGAFTHRSVVNRLPEIGRRMLAENWFPMSVTSGVEDLLETIPDGPIRQLSDHAAPDAGEWRGYIEPYEGQNWLQIPWFFAETYFYRRLMEATGYFGEIIGRSYGRGFDPFFLQKRKGFEANLAATKALCERVETLVQSGTLDGQAFTDLLRSGLWSNQADLSLWPVGSESDPSHGDGDQNQAYILADQSRNAAEYLFGCDLPVSRVDFLIDNAGFELVVDLALAIIMLETKAADTVKLHLKAHPTFVSDATKVDVRNTARLLASSGDRATASAGVRLQRFLNNGQMRLGQHFFWTSPLPMWEMPETVRQDLSQSSLVISKGDANYRRLLGDRYWPFETPFEGIVSYMPAPLAALRVLKSEVASGLSQRQSESTADHDPDWLINGRWGVIQFANPGS